MALIEKLLDLHKQATIERSHFYVGSVVKEAIDCLRWRDVAKEPPPLKKFVEVAKPSGYISTEYEFWTAKFDPEYGGWRTVANDLITDFGEEPTHWRPMPESPEAV